MQITKKFMIWMVLVLMLPACTPTVATRGNLVTDTKIEQIQPIISTRADIRQKWGPPTAESTFDPNTWYYIGERTAQEGLFATEVEQRRLIRVRFDENDLVIDIAEVDPRLAMAVDPVDRKTPTAGKEFTALQQFIGNLGRFNREGTGNRGIEP